MIGIGIGVNKALSNRKMIGGLVSIADYTNKVAGSTVENPHVAYNTESAALINPSSTTGEMNTTDYTYINKLDGVLKTKSTTVNGNMAQHRKSFNLIRHIEDRFKAKIPGATVTEKVQWIKDNVAKITANWWGFGSSPTGNKASFSGFYAGSWGSAAIHTNGTINKLSKIYTSDLGQIPFIIDANGFVHFLAYADPSDGVTASMLNTDYINLEIEYKNGAYVL